MMSRITRSAIVIAVGAAAASTAIGPAQAQLLDVLALQMCFTLPKDDDRLKCYDRIAAAMKDRIKPGDVAKSDDNTSNAGWQIKESRSPVDDSPQVTGTLFDKKSSANLFLRCQERQIEAGVQTTEFLGLGNEGSKVLFRINNDPPVTKRWSGASNHKSVFADNQFMNLLPDNGTLSCVFMVTAISMIIHSNSATWA